MKGKRLHRLLLVSIVFVFLLLQIPPPAASQDGEGVAVSESDVEMIGLTEYSGGGHMTVRISGEQAVELRRKILYLFDEYAVKLPEGFIGGGRITGWPTHSTPNGVLDEDEVLSYSKWVQYYQWERGVPYLFGEMTRAELLEGESADIVELSTNGLVGTSEDTAEPIEMRHLFNMKSSAQHRTYLLSDNLTVEGLYRIFSFHLSTDFEGPDSYPFSLVGEPTTNGWSLTDNGTLGLSNYSLWVGNASSGEYDRGMVASSYADFDLRFAEEATMQFRYMGQVVSGDNLRIQIQEEGQSYDTLQTLDSTDNTNNFQTLVLNLDDYVGNKVRVNFNFTSQQGGGQKDIGFFIDDFDMNAPCTYLGDIELHHTDYLVGVNAFPQFYSDRGTTHLIRTPAGMILTYSSSFESTDPSQDRAVFSTFDFLDNPQILFALMFICAYLISYFQNRFYNDYRRMYASMHREGWYKRKWLHAIGIVAIVLFVIFYFFPSLFVLAGADFYMLGLFLWIFFITVCVCIVIATKIVYLKAEQAIPPAVLREEEISVTVEAPEADFEAPPVEMAMAVPCSVCLEDLFDVAADGIKCRCGQVFHKDCAAKAERCPNCNRLLEVEKPKEKRMVTVKCPSCGDIVLIEGDADLLRINCESCGSILQEVAVGYNYLIVDDDPTVAYEEYKSVLKKDVPAMCVSTTFPEKLTKEFDIKKADLYWLSDTATDMSVKTLDPKRLDFEMMRAISNFFKESPGGVVMIDGLEYLVVENGFDRVLRFVKKINDLASVNDATIFVPLTPSSLGDDEFAMLRKEFDKVQILTAAPIPE
jgi:ribosomal protein S27E